MLVYWLIVTIINTGELEEQGNNVIEMGRYLTERYQIQELIGKGGFADVYLAFQSAVKRQVAIKIIRPKFATKPNFREQFEREAHLIAKIEHPHIVPLFDYWREDDSVFLVMRWLRGGTLRDRIHAGAMPSEEVNRILSQIASALTVAHSHNIVHCDIKPGNILLDEYGNVYLSDFGIAHNLSQTNGESEGISGSPYYLSPEQVDEKPVLPQSDIYSLGVTAYEMLTGCTPFQHEKLIDLLLKHVHEELPPLEIDPPRLSRQLDAVLRKATAKDPVNRYQTAESFAMDFHRTITGTQATETSEIFAVVPDTIQDEDSTAITEVPISDT